MRVSHQGIRAHEIKARGDEGMGEGEGEGEGEDAPRMNC